MTIDINTKSESMDKDWDRLADALAKKLLADAVFKAYLITMPVVWAIIIMWGILK